MMYKYFKNGNIHVKFDSDIDYVDDDYTYADMISIIYNSMLDCVEYENYDSYFSAIAIINQANGKTYDYVIPYEDIDKFFSGKWIVLYGTDEHAYIKIPRYYKRAEYITSSDKKFGCYYLDKKPSKDFISEMSKYGCMFKIAYSTYAPELRHYVMLVPYGAHVRYE